MPPSEHTAARGTVRRILSIAGVAGLAAIFALNSINNSRHEDYRNSNFAKFWVAGRMILTGENPYDPAQWHAAQARLGATWIPDRIFLYPLPQAFLLVPLTLLPPGTSFIAWGIVSQVVVAACCWMLLRGRGAVETRRLFFPLVIFLLFFGPVYLSLQIGSIGAVALAALAGAILLLDAKRSFAAGLALSVLILKPPQGVPILLLAGTWFLLQRDRRALSGTIAGVIALLASGLLYDPGWIGKFVANSEAVSVRTLGGQSNLFSLAGRACNGGIACTMASGGVLFLVAWGVTALLLRRYRERTAWEAFNLIIPTAFVSAIYLFGYDQIVYVIPITWICAELVQQSRSYVLPFLALVALDVGSMGILYLQATSQMDTWNAATTFVVLGLCIWLLERKRSRSAQSQPTA